jgi:hypothetical protein
VTCDSVGQWKTQSNGKDSCLSCVSNCKVCDDECTCLQCDSSFGVKFTERHECETCSSGDKVKLGEFCYSGTNCALNCQKCDSSRNFCETCESGYFLTANNQCQSCPSGCTACSNGGGCTSCQTSPKKYLLNGQCVDCVDEGQSRSGDNCIVCMKIFIIWFKKKIKKLNLRKRFCDQLQEL